MKRTILLLSLAIFLFVATLVYASKSSPWDAVWNAITSLQNQIKSPYLIDNNGQNLGKLLTYSPSNSHYTFLSDLDLLIEIKDVGLKAQHQTLYFEAENCVGTPYVNGQLTTQKLYRNDTGYTAFFKAVENDIPINLTSLSYTATSTPPIPNNCLNETIHLPIASHIQQVTLPFTEPIAGPLRIIEQ